MIYSKTFIGKKVLITGNTGFKGSWLTVWLLKLGAKIIGISKDIPTKPSLYETLKLNDKIHHYIEDIRNINNLRLIIEKEKPDFIFHLAAQAIVSASYHDPIETISTNAIGTMNILEILRYVKHKCIVVLITSDKCYKNVEWVWGYKETDYLGGDDVYSASKSAAEIIINTYIKSFLKFDNEFVKIGIARAGNVIGGGDWAKDRIVADCMRSWFNGEQVEIRCPDATRPWQHVLEPLNGYLTLASQLEKNPNLHGEAFNFGPRSEQNVTVLELIKDLYSEMNFNHKNGPYLIKDIIPFNESSLLKLNCDKSLFYLKWQSKLNYKETVNYVGNWYLEYKLNKKNMYDKTLEQIDKYEN